MRQQSNRPRPRPGGRVQAASIQRRPPPLALVPIPDDLLARLRATLGHTHCVRGTRMSVETIAGETTLGVRVVDGDMRRFPAGMLFRLLGHTWRVGKRDATLVVLEYWGRSHTDTDRMPSAAANPYSQEAP